jgi:hypothetical protein
LGHFGCNLGGFLGIIELVAIAEVVAVCQYQL